MPELSIETRDHLRDLSVEIASAYVCHHHIPATDLPGLIGTIHGALVGIANGPTEALAEEAIERPSPAQIRKSITPDALISFIDGKPYKTLKRHLTKFGLDPHSYRQRYGLPSDYPMTAPAYSATRSALAQKLGLGQRQAVAEEPAPTPAKSTKRASKTGA